MGTTPRLSHLRGIEAASVMLTQAWTEITHSGRNAFITLPCTKTDIVGLCVTRSHPCSCHRSPRLCPFHALRRHLDRMRDLGDPENAPLFPGEGCQPLQRHQTVEIFRSVIEATRTSITRFGPNGVHQGGKLAPGSLSARNVPCIAAEGRRQ